MKELSELYDVGATAVRTFIGEQLSKRKVTARSAMPEDVELKDDHLEWIDRFAAKIWKDAQMSLINEVGCTCLEDDKRQNFYSTSCMRHALEQMTFTKYQEKYKLK